MAKQPIFKTKYVQKLKTELNEEFYKSNEFVYDKKQVYVLPNIDQTEGLVEKLDINDDCKTAIAIYEAFENLEPIQASDERLWVYLAHVNLYPYMVKRWNAVQNGTAKDAKGYILEHWFLKTSAQTSLLRNWLSGLWWGVYLSVDESRSDKYELTKLFFRQLDFVTRTMGAEKFGRHREAVIGILEFIKENDELFKTKFEPKTRFIARHINFIGGVKPISYYDRHFFKSELEKVSDSISAI